MVPGVSFVVAAHAGIHTLRNRYVLFYVDEAKAGARVDFFQIRFSLTHKPCVQRSTTCWEHRLGGRWVVYETEVRELRRGAVWECVRLLGASGRAGGDRGCARLEAGGDRGQRLARCG
jgi:hypothetical protein